MIASVTRESSPPEAILRSGLGGSPGFGAKTISTRSAPPSGGGATVGSSPIGSASTSTASFASPRLRSFNCDWTAFANALQVFRRASVSASAATFKRGPGLGERGVERLEVGLVALDRRRAGPRSPPGGAARSSGSQRNRWESFR